MDGFKFHNVWQTEKEVENSFSFFPLFLLPLFLPLLKKWLLFCVEYFLFALFSLESGAGPVLKNFSAHTNQF
jgi:hypothetical protein